MSMSPIQEGLLEGLCSLCSRTGRGNGAGKGESSVHLCEEDTQAGEDTTFLKGGSELA